MYAVEFEEKGKVLSVFLFSQTHMLFGTDCIKFGINLGLLLRHFVIYFFEIKAVGALDDMNASRCCQNFHNWDICTLKYLLYVSRYPRVYLYI